jgi:hypothetical protein
LSNVVMAIYLLKDCSALRQLIRAVDPGYRKHSAIVRVGDKVSLIDLEWSGGTRHTYTVIDLTSHQLSRPKYDAGESRRTRQAPLVSLPDNAAIIGTGMVCGKTATATVFIRQSDLSTLLPTTA